MRGGGRIGRRASSLPCHGIVTTVGVALTRLFGGAYDALMNAKHFLLRSALVLCSLSLASAYVYSRSGGRFYWQAAPPPPVTPVEELSPALLPGSKSAAVLPQELEPTSPPMLLPGSKSLILSEPLAPAQQTQEAPAEQPPAQRALLQGTKSSQVDLSE